MVIHLEKFRTYILTFDFKVKVIITLSVMLAIMIISYSFYVICIKDEVQVEENKIDKIESMLAINEYEAKYKLKVKSNKNENEYEIIENANLLDDKYEYLLDGEIKIQIDKDVSTLLNQKINKSFEYSSQNKYNNFVSLASIIKYLKCNLDTKITKVECDNNTQYKIDITDLFPDITKIDILIDSSCKINEIKMYNKDSNVVYHLVYEAFKVKK